MHSNVITEAPQSQLIVADPTLTEQSAEPLQGLTVQTQQRDLTSDHPRDSEVATQYLGSLQTPPFGLILDQAGTTFATMLDDNNPHVTPIGSRKLNMIIRDLFRRSDKKVNAHVLAEFSDALKAKAEIDGVFRNVWIRVAETDDGIEIDLGDAKHTRVKITAGRVESIGAGSKTFFYRPQYARQMADLVEVADLDLLRRYVNLSDVDFSLLVAFITYTLAHPKKDSTKYVFLQILGGQGSGKSLLSRLVKQLIDPSVITSQLMPRNPKDIAIAAQQSHILIYDNLREITNAMSDVLCIASTGGVMAGRALYSDSDQHVLRLHVAMVLNGIHAFVDQPDLAERCLPLFLAPLPAGKRLSEESLAKSLGEDMPAIQRGLFDLIAKIFHYLPDVKPVSPARMIDFSRWLAAMELATDAEVGVFQKAFSAAQKKGQTDALMEDPFASAVVDFIEGHEHKDWTGTSTELLGLLTYAAPMALQRSSRWPQTAISLSKKLLALEAGLAAQDIHIEIGRRKDRTLNIRVGTGKF